MENKNKKMRFKYRAKNKKGKILEGIVEAENEFIARDLLKAKSLDIVTLRRETFSLNKLVTLLNRVTSKDLVIFFRQLAVMVEASIPLVKALKILAKQTSNPKLKEIVNELYQDVDSGNKLSEAMAKHEDAFNKYYINIIHAGESSGRLEEVLNYIADQQEKDHDLTSKIKGALIYPVVILIGMVGGGMVMMVKVMPELTKIFDNMGAELPWQTRAVIAASDFLVDYWYIVILITIAIIVAITYWKKTKTGSMILSKFKLHFPVFGKMFLMVYILQMMRSLYTLMIGGVNLVEALFIVEDVVDDPSFKKVLHDVGNDVNDGQPMAESLAKHKLIPDLVVNMIDIGEQSGRVSEMLNKVSDFYQKELDNMSATIMTLMEPFIMIFLGAGVMILVSAIFVPLYNLPGF